MLLAGLASMFLDGCAARTPAPMATHEAIAQQAEERRKTTAPLNESARQAPADMTKEDYERLGDQYVRQGNLTLAFAQYDRSLRRDPRQSRVRDKRGLLYVQNGLLREAQEEFQHILRNNAAYSPALEGLGQAYLQLGRFSDAEESFRRALQLNPRLWQSHAFLGMLYDSQDKHVKAIAEFQAALALKPGHQALANNLGRAYYSMGRYDDAIQHFRRALRTEPADPRISNNLALALAKAGRYEEAFDAFHKTGDPGNAYNNLGVMYWTAGKRGKAIACFQRAIEVSPAYDSTARNNLAAIQPGSVTQPYPEDEAGKHASASCLPAGVAHRVAVGSPSTFRTPREIKK